MTLGRAASVSLQPHPEEEVRKRPGQEDPADDLPRSQFLGIKRFLHGESMNVGCASARE